MIKEKKYYIKTLGCQMNKSDSERISGYLEYFGFQRTKKISDASLIILNTCGIRQTAEDRVYGFIPQYKKKNKDAKIILTGCLSKREDVLRRLNGQVDYSLNITDLPDFYLKLNDLFSLDLKPEKEFDREYLKIKPKLKHSFSAFVPIGNGCDNFCSYCVVPYARGREKYRDTEDILDEVRLLIENGYKEIILIAQNVNSYFFEDKNRNDVKFAHLLKMVGDIEGDFWVKFLTSHPKDMSDELIDVIANNDKICNFIHLPIQSGDNEILKGMNRKYTKEHYYGLICKIKDNIPDASITTDVIVGFPGETKEQFLSTAEMFKKVNYDMAYISQYSPRPGTNANKMEDTVSRSEKKEREHKLNLILQKTALENNKNYIDKTFKVLIGGKNKKGVFFGKTSQDRNVHILNSGKLDDGLIGEFVDVKIVDVDKFTFKGKLIF